MTFTRRFQIKAAIPKSRMTVTPMTFIDILGCHFLHIGHSFPRFYSTSSLTESLLDSRALVFLKQLVFSMSSLRHCNITEVQAPRLKAPGVATLAIQGSCTKSAGVPVLSNLPTLRLST